MNFFAKIFLIAWRTLAAFNDAVIAKILFESTLHQGFFSSLNQSSLLCH